MTTSAALENGLKISDLVEETGVSRELIHHYLRQGLLPPPPLRGRYSEQQVHLLNLIKRLREEHHLPLESIRSLFETFDFDPGLLEPLVLADSFSYRLSRFADGELALAGTRTTREVCEACGIEEERLRDYLKQRLVVPLEGQERYTDYDANIVTLCERGVELGIPFDAFRTVASHVRVAWQLEHAQFFQLDLEGTRSTDHALAQLFLRREIVGRFVQNVLDATIQRFLHRQLLPTMEAASSLEAVVFRPSAAFRRRHGIDEAIDRLQDRLAEPEADHAIWERVALLSLHGGLYREAAFLLEQALDRWPERPRLELLYGVASLLAGNAERGQQVLASADTPLGRLALALARLLPGGAREASFEVQARAAGDAVRAIEGADGDDPEGVLVRILGGWMLTAAPPAFQDAARGERLLAEVHRQLEGGLGGEWRLPGLRERLLVNAAYLLHECRSRLSLDDAAGLEALRTRVCSLDPGSAFAQRIFLEG